MVVAEVLVVFEAVVDAVVFKVEVTMVVVTMDYIMYTKCTMLITMKIIVKAHILYIIINV